jgi:hypothetical protein
MITPSNEMLVEIDLDQIVASAEQYTGGSSIHGG